MGQLVELQKIEADIEELNGSSIVVFREEKEGQAGAQKASTKTGFSPILVDYPVSATKAYSTEGFSTYLINEKGKVVAVLDGAVKTRPSGEIILEQAKKHFTK